VKLIKSERPLEVTPARAGLNLYVGTDRKGRTFILASVRGMSLTQLLEYLLENAEEISR
jgi:hypothetical protein